MGFLIVLVSILVDSAFFQPPFPSPPSQMSGKRFKNTLGYRPKKSKKGPILYSLFEERIDLGRGEGIYPLIRYGTVLHRYGKHTRSSTKKWGKTRQF